MSRRDIIGVLVLVGLFVALGTVMFMTFKPLSTQHRKAEDSYFVQQRMKILKSKQQP